MKLALEIIKREIAQRELANKHDHLRKDICTKELQELNDVVNLLSIHNVSVSLKDDAKDCLIALSYWDENEFKDALNEHHKLKGMRPMIITKKLLKEIINER